MYICYKCDGKLIERNRNQYLIFYKCVKCRRSYCLARDKKGTWSYYRDTSNLFAKNQGHWRDCTEEMHEKFKEKVIFT